MRALATPHRRARRGPRHGCQGTGWRQGKPRGRIEDHRLVYARSGHIAPQYHAFHTTSQHMKIKKANPNLAAVGIDGNKYFSVG